MIVRSCYAAIAIFVAAAAAQAQVSYPLDRTAYFVGELVPLEVEAAGKDYRLEAVRGDEKLTLYQGTASALWLDTTKLSAGEYRLAVNGDIGTPFYLARTFRRSAGSLQDESAP